MSELVDGQQVWVKATVRLDQFTNGVVIPGGSLIPMPRDGDLLRVGSIPPWLDPVPGWVGDMLDDVCGHGRRLAKSPGGKYEGQVVHRRGGEPCDDIAGLYGQTLYRLSPTGVES